MSKSVTQLNSDLSFYIPLGHNVATLALRVGGGHTFDGLEFYNAQFLGGTENLRGYRKYRFAGQTMAFNNVELRLKVSDFRTYLFPGSLGFLFFHDVGRVWIENDSSGKWHNGYGAGFWISPLRRFVITASYTASKEDKLPLITLGWQF
jgi:outer membrane protein assembly factor BamA